MGSDEIMNAEKSIAVRTTRVVMRKGTYPSLWRRKAESKDKGK
jgi:H/ACA ribonucleoprotein complex subunit 4